MTRPATPSGIPVGFFDPTKEPLRMAVVAVDWDDDEPCMDCLTIRRVCPAHRHEPHVEYTQVEVPLR